MGKLQAEIVVLTNTLDNFPTCDQSELPLEPKYTKGCTAAFNP